MAHYQFDNTLNHEKLHNIRRRLPALDVNAGVDFERAAPDLAVYFHVYGFDAMAHSDGVQYSLGSIRDDAVRVATHCWFVEQPKGTVFVVHGLFDHVGLFLDVVDYLLGLNFSVVAIDLPGHGLSDGNPVEVSHFDEYGQTITAVLKYLQREIPQPIYALGQSTGCAALLNYVLAARGQSFDKLVLFAPLVQPRHFTWVSFLHTILRSFTPSVARTFRDNSHCADFNRFLRQHDPLQCRIVSVNWISAMRAWVKRFPSLAVVKLPTLVIQGDNDQVVDWQINIPKITAKLPSSRVEMISGGMHHLANEGDLWRDQVFAAVRQFLIDP